MNAIKAGYRPTGFLKWVPPVSSILLALLFTVFIVKLDDHTEKRAQTRMNEHARVVAGNLWNFNLEGVRAYLDLAAETYGYESVVITDHRGHLFWSLPQRPCSGLEGRLLKTGLIPRIPLSSPIAYEGRPIGTIEAVWVKNTLAEKAYAFFFLTLCLTVVFLYIRVLEEKAALEDNVRERTRELLNSNTALKHEIVERARIEEALRNSEEKHRFLAENINDVIWTMDLDLNYTYISPVAGKLHGWTDEDLKTLTVKDVLTPESYEIAAAKLGEELVTGSQTGRYNRSVTLILEMYSKDGSTLFCEIKSSFIVNEDGVPTGIMGVTRNITDRMKAQQEKDALERQLDRSRKMESLGLLAGGVAHDLNNVLSGIVSYPEILLLDLPEDSPLYRPISLIRDSGLKAAAIVEDLLTLARRGVMAKETMVLNHTINEYLASPEHEKLMAFHPRVSIRLQLEDQLPGIKGSRLHIKKTLMNLVANAAEAQPRGGTITLSTQSRYLDKPMTGFYAVDEGEYVVLTVSDEGEGISENDMQRIFEPFYTKKVMGRSGTGLGLAVVWGTVQDHKGFINLSSHLGLGTVFELYFPLVRATDTDKEEPATIESIMGKDERILVVDDVTEQREIAGRMLSRLNYQVHTVSSGEEAVEYLKHHQADCVVLDMIMDPGMDGLDTYKQIIAMNPDQRAIIVSGYSETDRVREAQHLGVAHYIKKPYMIESIGQAIRQALNR
ncbi:hypothetical protein JCM14469_21660 [Desulfatiferula olefinivorans]